jgi:hypothetical protein
MLDKATVYRQIRKTFEAAKIELPRRGGRTLRNTFAAQEIRAGASNAELIEKLGLNEAFFGNIFTCCESKIKIIASYILHVFIKYKI